MNLTLSSPTTLAMGDGGLLKRNTLQCLHTAYNLSQQYRTNEWSDLGTLLTGSECKQVIFPVMSWWEHVGQTTYHVTRYKVDW